MTATGIRDVVTDANRFKRLVVSPPCQAKSWASETTFSSWHYIYPLIDSWTGKQYWNQLSHASPILCC